MRHRIKLNCYIPLAHGQAIPCLVLSSLLKQGDINTVPCCTDGIIASNHDQHPDNKLKVAGESRSRNLALSFIKQDKNKYALMQDRDIVHDYENNYQCAIRYLEENERVGVVSLPWLDKTDAPHIKMQAMVLRISALDGFTFRRTGSLCMCHDVARDMKSNGWEYCYLPSDKKLITELKNT